MANRCIVQSNPEYQEIKRVLQDDDMMAIACAHSYWKENPSKDGTMPSPQYALKWYEQHFDVAFNEDDTVTSTNSEEFRQLMDTVLEDINSNTEESYEAELTTRYKAPMERMDNTQVNGILDKLRKEMKYELPSLEDGTPQEQAASFVKEAMDGLVNGEIQYTSERAIKALMEKYPSVSEQNAKSIVMQLQDRLENIKENFVIIATNLPVQWNGEANSIDMVVRDKRTGAIGIIDYRTEKEGLGVRISKFQRMNEFATKDGKTKWDKYQIESLANKEIINSWYSDKYGQDAPFVDFRAFLPISLNMTEDKLDSVSIAKIYNTEQAGEDQTFYGTGLYLMNDTAAYLNEAHANYNLPQKYSLGSAMSLEHGIEELGKSVKNMALEWKKFAFRDTPKQIVKHMTGLNVDTDIDTVFKAAGKLIASSQEILKKNPSNMNIIGKVMDNADTLRSMMDNIGTINREQALRQLSYNVYGNNDEAVLNNFIESFNKTLDGVRRQVGRLEDNVQQALGVYLSEKSPGIRDVCMHHFIEPKYYDKAVQQIQEEVNDKAFTEEKYRPQVQARFEQLLEQNKNIIASEAQSYADSLLGLGGHNALSAKRVGSWVDVLFSKNTFFNRMIPISKSGLPVAQHIINLIQTSKDRAMEASRERMTKLEELHNGIKIMTGKKLPKDIYDFMLDTSDPNHPKIVQMYDQRALNDYKRQTLYDTEAWKEADGKQKTRLLRKWNRENLKAPKMETIWENEGADVLKFFNEETDVFLNDTAKAEAYAAYKMGKQLDRYKQAGFITEAQQKRWLKKLSNQANISMPDDGGYPYAIRKADETMEGTQYVQETDNVAEHLRGYWSQMMDKFLVPGDQFLTEKGLALAQMSPHDPRRQFYDMWQESIELYDSIVPEIKRVGSNLPSVFASRKEQRSFEKALQTDRDTLGKQYRKSADKGPSFLSNINNPEWSKKWVGSDPDLANRSFEYNTRIPLAYSGYPINASQQSYNLAYTAHKLMASFDNYYHLLPKIAEIETMYSLATKANRMNDNLRGTQKQAPTTPEMEKLRTAIDMLAYNDAHKWNTQAFKLLRTFLSWTALNLMAFKPGIAIRSHLSSATSLREGFYYNHPFFSQKNLLKANSSFVKNFMTGMPLWEGFSNKPLCKQTAAIDWLGVKTGDIQHLKFPDTGSSGLSMASVMNAAYFQLKMTDATHASVATENYLRTKTTEVGGKQVPLWNLLHFDRSTGQIVPDKALSKGQWQDILSQGRRVVQDALATTTSVTNLMDKSVVAYNPGGAMQFMIKTIGVNGLANLFQPRHWNPTEGRWKIGSMAALFSKEPHMHNAGTHFMARLTGMYRFAMFMDKLNMHIGGGNFRGADLRPEDTRALSSLAFGTWTSIALFALGNFLCPSEWLPINREKKKEKWDEMLKTPYKPFDETWFKQTLANYAYSIANEHLPIVNLLNMTSELNPLGLAFGQSSRIFNFIKQAAIDLGEGRMEERIDEEGNFEPKLWKSFKDMTGVLNAMHSFKHPENALRAKIHDRK